MWYKILILFGIPLKLVWLIKMLLNENYTRIRLGKYLSDLFPIENGLRKRSFIAIAFQLSFRVRH